MLDYTKAFSSYSIDSISKAKEFYTGKLDMQVTEESDMPILRLHLSSDTDIMLYEKPDHQPATFTVLNFVVDDIEKAVDELTSKGIVFEQYGGEIQTDDNGIHRSHGVANAWFKDPAGNIISVLKMEE
jgi:predicted enzyme related to lactoylglutathione lyase